VGLKQRTKKTFRLPNGGKLRAPGLGTIRAGSGTIVRISAASGKGIKKKNTIGGRKKMAGSRRRRIPRAGRKKVVKKKTNRRTPRPQPTVLAMKRIHTVSSERHAVISRTPLEVHSVLDVQKGRSEAVRGKGVRGPSAEEMKLIFGKTLKKKKT